MGQQQLLLVVIGVILVGLMVVVGMSIFVDHAIHMNRESLGNDLLNMAARAHEYYRKPQTVGGGGRSFVGLTKDAAGLAKLSRNPVNDNGSYSIFTAGTSSMVELEGIEDLLREKRQKTARAMTEVGGEGIRLLDLGR